MTENLLDFDTLAEDNIRTLLVPGPSFRRPLCIILVGIPASGKSTLTEKLRDKFPLTVIDEEAITSFLAPRATVLKRGTVEVFNLADKTIEHLLKRGKPCIYDANLKSRQHRQLIEKAVRDCGGSYLLIYLDCPKEICYRRLQKHNLAVTSGETKGFILDKDFFEYEVATTRTPAPDETHIRYSCEGEENLAQVYSVVEKLLGAGKV